AAADEAVGELLQPTSLEAQEIGAVDETIAEGAVAPGAPSEEEPAAVTATGPEGDDETAGEQTASTETLNAEPEEAESESAPAVDGGAEAAVEHSVEKPANEETPGSEETD